MTKLLQDIKNTGFAIVVVDDGSGEQYAETFHQASESAVVLSYPENKGKGHALKVGLKYIQEHYYGDYVIVTMDADGQHAVSDALRICETAQNKPSTLVLGSRLLQKKVPLRSRFGNTMTRFIYGLTTGLHIHDTQTGLRAFSSQLLPTLLEIGGERYEYEMNVLLEFSRRKLSIEEVTISTIYFDNNSGSHFDAVKDSYRIYREILKFSASSLTAFLVDYGLYAILTAATGGMGAASLAISNITARIVSASVNYTINRRFVFKSEKNIKQTALQYFLFAAVILLGNTVLLNLLVHLLQINRYWAKLLTEVVFFSLSWSVQRLVIFRKVIQ